MRALIVTSMYPGDEHPARGSFVRDQVRALERIEDVMVEVYAFEPGSVAGYLSAGRDLRRRYKHQRFDVVHAHFGLTAWPALAAPGRLHAVTLHGTDLEHPRSRAITLASLRLLDLVGVVSEPLSSRVPRWAVRTAPAVLPCGVDLDRFRPLPRREVRGQLGLDPDRRYVLFPADPGRPEKRYDRAAAVADGAELLTLRNVEPARVPLLVNAANAVLIPSEREGFGLAVLEALACDVPVLATNVGIAPAALDGVEGTYCGPFDEAAWVKALAPHLADPDPRVAGRAHAEPFSADRMASKLVAAWQATLASGRR